MSSSAFLTIKELFITLKEFTFYIHIYFISNMGMKTVPQMGIGVFCDFIYST